MVVELFEFVRFHATLISSVRWVGRGVSKHVKRFAGWKQGAYEGSMPVLQVSAIDYQLVASIEFLRIIQC